MMTLDIIGALEEILTDEEIDTISEYVYKRYNGEYGEYITDLILKDYRRLKAS